MTSVADERLERIMADILPENREMQHICQKLGFRLDRAVGDPTVRANVEL